MSHEQNNPGRFEPLHEAHAIEQVAFAFQVDRPLDDSLFSQICDESEKYKTDLPGRVDMQGMMFAMGTSGPTASSVVGIAYRRTNPAGVIEAELRIERVSISFRTTVYTRWDSVWAQARKYFDELVPKYLKAARIAGISLNYLDRFVWRGAASSLKPDLLLRKESLYVAPHVYGESDMWHSHTGVFLRPDAQTKRLLNVNIDCVDGNPPTKARNILITTLVNDTFDQPGYEKSSFVEKDAASILDERMQQLHNFGKVVFGNVINDEVRGRIGLVI